MSTAINHKQTQGNDFILDAEESVDVGPDIAESHLVLRFWSPVGLDGLLGCAKGFFVPCTRSTCTKNKQTWRQTVAHDGKKQIVKPSTYFLANLKVLVYC